MALRMVQTGMGHFTLKIMKPRKPSAAFPLFFALLMLTIPSPLPASGCNDCKAKQAEKSALEGQLAQLEKLEAANKAYLEKPGLSDSVKSKIQSNLLVIGLKRPTLENLLKVAAKKTSESCSGCP